MKNTYLSLHLFKKIVGFCLMLIITCVLNHKSVNALPVANFTVNIDSGCVPLTVTFTNTSTAADSFYWDFGDYTYFSGIDTAHTYNWNNAFVAKLTAFDSLGNKSIKTHLITVYPYPFSSFSASKVQACPGTVIDFSNWSSDKSNCKWNFGDGSPVENTVNPSHKYNIAGSYNVSLTVNNMCGLDSSVQTITISNSTIPIASFSVSPNPACTNEPIKFYNSSSDKDSSYWTFGDGSTSTVMEPLHPYATAGVYTVSLVVTNICGKKDTLTSIVTIDSTFLPNPSASGSPNPVCPSDAVQFSVSGGVYYSWDLGDGTTSTGQYFKHAYFINGIYNAIVTATNYCGNSKKDTVIVVVDTSAAPNASVFSFPIPACPGDSVSFSVYGGSFIDFLWSFGDGTNSTENYPKHVYVNTGSYTVSVIVTNLCGKKDTATSVITIDNSSTPWVSFWPSPQVACPNSPIVFDASASSGVTYLWNFGDGTTSTLSDPIHSFADTGIYYVFVIVTNKCGNIASYSSMVTISYGSKPTAAISASPSFTVCVNEYIYFYNSTWYSNNFWYMGNGDSIVGEYAYYKYTTPGTYTVTLIAKDSCGSDTATVIVKIIGPPVGNFGFSTVCGVDSVFFTDSTTGSPVSWFWNFGDGGTSNKKNTAHLYPVSNTFNVSLIVANSNNCKDTVIKPVTAGSTFTVSYNKLDLTCKAVCSGSIDVTITGGLTPYTYKWSSGVVTQDLTGICAGSYTLTVIDATPCTAFISVIINEPLAMTSAIISTNLKCNGDGSGAIDLSVSGGTPSYTYSWSNGVQTQDQSNLPAGNYTVTVFDYKSCAATQSVTLTEPTAISIIITKSDATCGNSDGQATASVSGGTAPYTYKWSNSQTTSLITNLAVGAYTLTITDNINCKAFSTVTINEIGGPSAGISTSTNVSCNGGNDGAATVTAIGGTLPYTYKWSNGTASASVNSLTAGNYTVTVKDGSGCKSIATASITEPSLLIASTSSIGVSCFGGNDGSASVSATGGTAPYTYNWNTGINTQSISALVAGTYVTTIYDSNGCKTIDSAVIGEPSALTVSITSANVSCNGGSDGSANATASGGTASYSFVWSNGTITQSVNNLTAGIYIVTVTDSKGCKTSGMGTISEPAGMSLTTSTKQANCLTSNGQASVNVSGGISPYTYAWSNGEINDTIFNVPSGLYSLTVTDANGCFAYSSVTINEIGAPSVVVNISDATCGLNNGKAITNVSGGTLPYTFSWSNGASTDSIGPLTPGAYMLTVTDNNGCKTIVGFSIADLASPVVNLGNDTSICSSLGVKLDAQNQGAVYLWSNGPTTQTIKVFDPGTYFVLVTDTNGCTETDTIVVSWFLSCDNVWPGDANNDFTANHFDILPIGLSYNDTGVSRDVTSIIWQGFPSMDWNDTLNNGIDKKYVDCNGDGIINYNDVLAIINNFNKTHSKTSNTNQYNAANPDLYFEVLVPNVAPGTEVEVKIMAGKDSVSLYGIAFDVKVNMSYIEPGSLFVKFDNSWLGVDSVDMIKIGVVDETNGLVYAGCVRNNGINKIDSGQIATLRFVIDSSVTNQEIIPLEIQTIKAIGNFAGDTVSFNNDKDTINIKPVGISKIINNFDSFNVFPNPYKGSVQIVYGLQKKTKAQIDVYNILGEKISTIVNSTQEKGNYSYSFSAKKLGYTSGVYVLQVKLDDKIITKRLVELE